MTQLETTMNTISQALDANDVAYHTGERHASFEIGYRCKAAHFSIIVGAQQDPHLVLIIVKLPFVVPEDRRPAMAEAVVRANYGAIIGRFDLNMSKGDLNHAITVPLGDAELSASLFEEVLGCAVARCERYHRAFGRLLFDPTMSAAEACAEVEMALADAPRPT